MLIDDGSAFDMANLYLIVQFEDIDEIFRKYIDYGEEE